MTADVFSKMYVDYITDLTRNQTKHRLFVLLVITTLIVMVFKDVPIATLSVLVSFLCLSMTGTYQKFISDNLQTVLILSVDIETIIKKFISLTAKRTAVSLSISISALVVLYGLRYSISSITPYDFLFILFMAVITMVLNSMQWQLSVKYKRSVSYAAEFAVVAVMCMCSVLFMILDQFHVIVGIALLCVLLAYTICESSRHLKVPKEKILLGV